MTLDEILETLSKEELLARWQQLPGRPFPPARVDRLRRELAYREQERSYGRLDKNTTVSLRRHMAEFGKSLRGGMTTPPPGENTLQSGARSWFGSLPGLER